MSIAEKLAALRKALDELEAVVLADGCPCCGSKAGCPCRVPPPSHPAPIAPGRAYWSFDGDYSSVAAGAERSSRAAADKLQMAPRESFRKRAQRLADRVQGLRGMNDSAWCNLVTLAAEEFEAVANEVTTPAPETGERR